MASSIWKVATTRVGTIQPFSSEYDMEAFIMNNPKIIGCIGDSGAPCVIRHQLGTVRTDKSLGRIDIIGLAAKNDAEDGKYELRIFELKKDVIDLQAVGQLASYLEKWSSQGSAKDDVRKWMKNEIGEKHDDDDIETILNQPVGVLVGSRFLPDAIESASDKGMLGIRLARFSSTDKEFFIVVEEQIGTPVSRQLIGWETLLKLGIIGKEDTLETTIRTPSGNEKIITALPVLKGIPASSKNIRFAQKDAEELLGLKNTILEKSRNETEKEKAQDLDKYLKSDKGMALTTATGFIYLAYDLPKTHSSYWVPAPLWKLTRTGKHLCDILEEAKGQ
jgi:hypothetical protein